MSNANSTAPASRRGAAQRLSEYRRYWDEDRETMDPRLRQKKIVERIQHQLRYAYEKAVAVKSTETVDLTWLAVGQAG